MKMWTVTQRLHFLAVLQVRRNDLFWPLQRADKLLESACGKPFPNVWLGHFCEFVYALCKCSILVPVLREKELSLLENQRHFL
jgi:hypothetical protein